ncbi:MAG: STAS domain-containing protein [Acidobacteriota bacterium]|nr:STAS domain-containing protein [Acidobacteriota bacterium]
MLHETPLTIDRKQGRTPDTCIFSLTGPLILRNMFELQSELRSAKPQGLTVIDLTGVPYMDSAGMGLVMNHFVHCQSKGARMIVSGANSRIMELFKITKIDRVLQLAATIDEAEAGV